MDARAVAGVDRPKLYVSESVPIGEPEQATVQTRSPSCCLLRGDRQLARHDVEECRPGLAVPRPIATPTATTSAPRATSCACCQISLRRICGRLRCAQMIGAAEMTAVSRPSAVTSVSSDNKPTINAEGSIDSFFGSDEAKEKREADGGRRGPGEGRHPPRGARNRCPTHPPGTSAVRAAAPRAARAVQSERERPMRRRRADRRAARRHGACRLPARASRRLQTRSAQKSIARATSAHVSTGMAPCRRRRSTPAASS